MSLPNLSHQEVIVIAKVAINIGTTVIVLYDHLLTLDSEITLFWRRKFTLSSALFYFNRYLSLLLYGLVATGFTDSILNRAPYEGDLRSCYRYEVAIEILILVPLLFWAAFSALRMYALSGRNSGLSAIVFLLSSVPFVTNTVLLLPYLRGYEDAYTPCYGDLSAEPSSLRLPFVLSSQIPPMVADIIVVITSVRVACRMRPLYSRTMIGLRSSSSFFWVLFRDGVVYFVVVFCMNILHIIFSTLNITVGATYPGGSILPLFTNAFTTILVSRAFINLQRVNKRITAPSTILDIPSVDFTTSRVSTLPLALQTATDTETMA